MRPPSVKCEELPLNEGVCTSGVMLEVALPSPLAQGLPLSFAVHHCQSGSDWIAEVVFALAGTTPVFCEPVPVVPDDCVPESLAGVDGASAGCASVPVDADCGSEAEFAVEAAPPQASDPMSANKAMASEQSRYLGERQQKDFELMETFILTPNYVEFRAKSATYSKV